MNHLSDIELIIHALTMWCNYIETGDVTTSAKDAENANTKICALSRDQMKFIIRLNDLANTFRDTL